MPYPTFLSIKSRPRLIKGFTLVELLVVISIIGLLASISMVSLNNARIKARDAKRKADLSQVRLALAFYYDDKTQYPSSGDLNPSVNNWNTILRDALTSGSKPYVLELPMDPSNRDIYVYKYASNGSEFIIYYETEDTTDASPQVLRGY